MLYYMGLWWYYKGVLRNQAREEKKKCYPYQEEKDPI